ncbi:hypothetical protein F5884DRAFT_858425 [Xylogone sp. PMI_703]|nr:hypothetical protein F5884DRAFT_858425 [Xylogone sp. PMI_703]
MAEIPHPFGIIPTGCPVIVDPTSIPSETSFVYTLPARKFSHIVVFLLPGITLPPNTAAAIYMAVAPSKGSAMAAQQETFKFLGGIGTGKESGIFKINNLTGGGSTGTTSGEVDMDAPDTPQISEITIGISIEPAESVAARMPVVPVVDTNPDGSSDTGALVRVGRGAPSQQATLIIAQRIIKNAFDYLASFGGNMANGVEVVPLKAFNDWWKKFESRVRTDPSFLERVSD